jgi:hypothetical protein
MTSNGAEHTAPTSEEETTVRGAKKWFPDDFSNKRDLWRAGLAEFLAMCMFVFVGCGSVTATGEFLVDDAVTGVKANVARVMPIATTFGIAIVVLAFSVGPISGGHINPAVTLALLIQRRISPRRAIVYMLCQFAGSCAGALILWGGISNAAYAPLKGIENLQNFTLGTDVIPAIQRPPFLLGANQRKCRIAARWRELTRTCSEPCFGPRERAHPGDHGHQPVSGHGALHGRGLALPGKRADARPDPHWLFRVDRAPRAHPLDWLRHQPRAHVWPGHDQLTGRQEHLGNVVVDCALCSAAAGY